MNEAYSLGSIGGTESVKKLLIHLDDEVWQGRRAAVESLGNLRHPEALPGLIKKLTDDSWQVRQGTAFALGYLCKEARSRAVDIDPERNRKDRCNEDNILKCLMDRLVNDKEWRVRQACASAMRSFDREKVSIPLISALKDRDWHVQCTAAESLGELRDPMAKKPLENMLKTADPMAKRIFKNAMLKIDGKIPPVGKEQGRPDSAKRISREELVDMKQESEGGCAGCTPQ